MTTDNVKYRTIRKTAASEHISENLIRRRVAQGKCPGIYSGNRFLVNVDALLEQLDAESRQPKEAKV